jgi:hypothetical protein
MTTIVELRQYTLHPGKRDVLVDLFDRELVESQESLGMQVIGQFRDVDDPDRFVWLRGFRDMATRADGLKGFYGGPVWKDHRDVANATMIDSDNVLLLRPAKRGFGFAQSLGARSPRGATGHGSGLVVATVYSLVAPAGDDFIAYFSREVEPALADGGAILLALFVTDDRPNNFPALPIREDENAFVWFAGFADAARGLRWEADHPAVDGLSAGAPGLNAPPQRLRLTPTARSLLTGASLGCPAAATLDLGY